MCFNVYVFYQEAWKVEWFDVIQNRMFLEMVGLHFLYNKESRGIPLGSFCNDKLLAAAKRQQLVLSGRKKGWEDQHVATCRLKNIVKCGIK